MFFETSTIYRVDPDERCLEPRHGSVLVNKDLDQYEARLPLWVGGVDRSDLAIFGTALNEGGLTDLDLLVIDSTTFRGSAYVAPPWIIEAFPDLQTMELAKKFTIRDFSSDASRKTEFTPVKRGVFLSSRI